MSDALAHALTDAQVAETVETFDRRAALYAARYAAHPPYIATFDVLLGMMGPDHLRVLDLACGPGSLGLHLRSRRPGLALTGTDLSPAMLRHAAAACPAARWLQLDLRDTHRIEGVFDVVACAFGLPYLDADGAAALLDACAQLLRPGGLLYLSTIGCAPELRAQQSALGDRAWRCGHPPERLRPALEARGFTLRWSDELLQGDDLEHFFIAQREG
jgi:SAM-dependent methyltransferase